MEPRLPTQLSSYDAGKLEDRISIEEALLEDLDLEGAQYSAIDISRSELRNPNFAQSKLKQFLLTDVRVSRGFLFGAYWDGTYLKRVTFTDCAASGITLSGGGLTKVRFQGCKLNLANFRQSVLVDVEFIDCQLQEVDFLDATLRNVKFINCELEGVSFDGAELSKVDLTESEISATIGALSLKGAKITTAQLFAIAPRLAIEAGIEIVE